VSAIIIHGCLPDTFTVNTVIPIPKGHNVNVSDNDKKLIRRWDSERELALRWHRTRITKYNRLVHKFRHRSTRLCVGTQV